METRTVACNRSAVFSRVPVAKRFARKAAVRVQAVAAPASPKYQRPDANGRFGKFGGKYVPETLIPALEELEMEYKKAQADPSFQVHIAYSI